MRSGRQPARFAEATRAPAAINASTSSAMGRSRSRGEPVRRKRPGVADAELDASNLALLDRINARRRVYLTGTKLKGRYAIRICVLSFRTHRDRMEQALEDIRAAVAEGEHA
jgi:hypothetical protein